MSEKNHPFPYQFIAIEGNIGTGKTTLCQAFEARYGCSLLLEQFTDNPFLPVFYANPERYAFPVELFFMSERHKQLQAHFSSPDLFQTLTVSDYFFVKTLLFARRNLPAEEFRLFQQLFSVLNATFPKPDILVYLHRPVEVLLRQIAKRGRDMETGITAEYLTGLQQAYLDYLRTVQDFPVIVLDMQEADFVQQPAIIDRITGLLAEKHPLGVQYLTL